MVGPKNYSQKKALSKSFPIWYPTIMSAVSMICEVHAGETHVEK
jgi:hypothetical protein